MFKLRYGYLISGILIGCILLFNFVTSFPDGKLHIFFCNVGQGDAAYIKFPDGRDMMIDGGPDASVLSCLARHMPFWDRRIDMVLMSHPQADHYTGLISILARYRVDYFVKSDVIGTAESYATLMREVADKKILVKLMARGQAITLGPTSLTFIWPSSAQIAYMSQSSVLGASTDLNDGCLVFWLHYGQFDALFPGDADQHVENYYTGDQLAEGQFEVLKVPHHGSKTGMTQAFVDWVHPKLAVISVGKNFFGHPAPEAITMLQNSGARVLRTDKSGDIEVISDGKVWIVR